MEYTADLQIHFKILKQIIHSVKIYLWPRIEPMENR